MSFYSDYINERTNDQIIEGYSGFVTYRYINDGKSVYIIDIYVIPEERKKGGASALAGMVIERAKEKGCIEVIGTVVPSMKGCTISMKVLLAYGFELQTASNDLVILRKDI